MDVLRTGVSVEGCLQPQDTPIEKCGDRLVAVLPSILLYWYHFATNGERIDEATSNEKSIAGHFLHLLHQAPPDPDHQRCLDVSLILYAEHEFNASTFTARVISSTRSDYFSAVCGAIGALRGPLHGGANEAAMELIERFSTPEEAEVGIREMLAAKELIIGLRPSSLQKI